MCPVVRMQGDPSQSERMVKLLTKASRWIIHRRLAGAVMAPAYEALPEAMA